MLDTVRQDLKYSARALVRTPLFRLTAVVSLALGIAGNAAIFSLADALILRSPAGIRDYRQMVDVGRSENGRGFRSLSYPAYQDLRDRNTVLDGLAAYRESEAVGLGSSEGAERVYAMAVSANYFAVLGTPIALGRSFTRGR